jgi:hypothetical protein
MPQELPRSRKPLLLLLQHLDRHALDGRHELLRPALHRPQHNQGLRVQVWYLVALRTNYRTFQMSVPIAPVLLLRQHSHTPPAHVCYESYHCNRNPDVHCVNYCTDQQYSQRGCSVRGLSDANIRSRYMLGNTYICLLGQRGFYCSVHVLLLCHLRALLDGSKKPCVYHARSKTP